jgi:hypothetical protein
MKTYDYLVSYNFSAQRYIGPGTGTIQISRKKKIKTFDDINELNKMITEAIDGSYNVAVSNFILLGRNKH